MPILSTLVKTIIIQIYNNMHQSDPHKKGCQFETPKGIQVSNPLQRTALSLVGLIAKFGLGQTTHVKIAWVSVQDVGS